MSTLRTRIHVWTLTLLLTALAIWLTVTAASTGYWPYYVSAAAVLSAAVGVATWQRWARYLIYILGVSVILEWLWFVIPDISSGALADRAHNASTLLVVLWFVPAAGLFFFIGYCCYVAHTYVGKRHGYI